IMINPILIYKSNTFINTIEGCLSIPNIYEKVKRYDYIEIEYININNIKKNIKINKNSSLLLSCIQHEIDHLNGILFIDKISDIKKYLIFKKLNKK
ncbi:peptide deformylase, partial [Candidatus Nardonella dryophthoridicola]